MESSVQVVIWAKINVISKMVQNISFNMQAVIEYIEHIWAAILNFLGNDSY